MSYDEETISASDDGSPDIDLDEPLEPLEMEEGLGYEDDEDPDNHYH